MRTHMHVCTDIHITHPRHNRKEINTPNRVSFFINKELADYENRRDILKKIFLQFTLPQNAVFYLA